MAKKHRVTLVFTLEVAEDNADELATILEDTLCKLDGVAVVDIKKTGGVLQPKPTRLLDPLPAYR